MNEVDNKELVDMAKKAMNYAYSPYSEFKVGAALKSSTGKVFLGCNIENSSYGATNCAERTAIFKAVSEGETEFEAIAIVSSSGKLTFPCGICRQVMSEFFDDDTKILLEENNEIKTFMLKDFLPNAFMFQH